MNNLIVFHVNNNMGTGHFYRALTLQKSLDGDTFFYLDATQYDSKFTANHNLKNLIFYNSNPFENINNIVEEYSIKNIILDVKDTTEKYIFDFRKTDCKIISIDDLGPGRNYVDLLIDANLPGAEVKNKNRLIGPEYMILDPIFREYNIKQKIIKNSVCSIFLFFGGSDPNNIIEKLMKYKKLKDYKLTILTNNKNIKAERNITVYNYLDKKEISKILFHSDIAVISGGIFMYETLSTGTPCITIAQDTDQHKNIMNIVNNEVLLYYGSHKELNENNFIELLNKIKSVDFRKKISYNAKTLVDAKGVERINNALRRI